MQNIKGEFEKWLIVSGHTKKYAPASVLACLEKSSEYIVSRNLYKGGIWTISEASKFNDVRNRMMRDKIFKVFDKSNFKLFEKVAAFYYNFLKANEPRLKILFTESIQAEDLKNQQMVKIEPQTQVTKNEMTIAEAMIEVLKIKSPLTSSEIYKEIVARGLYVFGAKSPWSVVLNTLMNHSEGNTSYDRTSKRKYFKIIYLDNGNKAFALIESDEGAVAKESDDSPRVKISVSDTSKIDWLDTTVQAFGGWILKQGKSVATSRQYTSNIKVLVSRYKDEFESATQEVTVKDKMLRFIELLISNPQFAEIEAAPAQHNRFTAALQALSEFFGSPLKIRVKSKADIATSKTKTRVFDTPEAVIYDWENNEKLYGSKPFSVQFFNTDKKVEVENWTLLFVAICEYIVERQPSIDFLSCNDSYSGTRTLCSTIDTKLASPKKLTNGQFVETNHSSNRLMKIAKLFLEYAGEDLSKVAIIYYPVSVSTESTSDKQVAESNDDLTKRVIEYVKTKRFKGASLDEVVECLKDKRARVQRAIRAAKNIVEFGAAGPYVCEDEFVDLDEAREAMKSILQRYFARFDGVATSKILYDAVKIKLEVFLNDNDLDDEQKIYWLAWHFFGKTGDENYHFYANCFIWEVEPRYPKSIGGLLVNLANKNGGFFTKVEAVEYLNQLKLSTQILQAMGFSGSKRDFVLYGNHEYLYFPMSGIDAEGLTKIQQSLTRYFDENFEETFIIIRQIDDDWLASLPQLPMGKPWTHLLLQDILCQNELGFETVKCLKGQDADTMQAAIVRKKDRMSFADVVWDFLSKKYELPREFGADELRLLIRDAGMIAGNELVSGMHKALNERRFVWQNNDTQVKVLALTR